MRSSIRIQDCLSCTGTDEDAEAQRATLRERILKELYQAILKTEKRYGGSQGNITVYVSPRRFQLYGWLQVFREYMAGEYRLTLPVESRIVSDRNISKNAIRIMKE